MTAPTTAEINANIIAQLEASLNQSIPLLPKAFNRVISKALAAVIIILYKLAGFNAQQQFVRYASYSPTTVNGLTFTPLIEWGRLIGVGDPIPATYAEFEVDLLITLSTGTAQLTEGTLFRAAENGFAYAATATVLIDSNDSTVSVPVRATTQPGQAGNVVIGSAVVLAQPTTGVDPNGTRGVELVTAQDREAEEDYRRRVDLRFRQRPQGGALIDYRAWGEDAGDVRCYPYRSDILEGQIVTYVRSISDPLGGPTLAQLQAVLDYQTSSTGAGGINDRLPVNANIVSTPAESQAYAVQVDGLTGTTNEAEAKAAIIEAVEQYFDGLEPYIVGLDTGPRTDSVTYFSVVGVVQPIVSQYNGSFTDLSLTRAGSPVINEQLPRGTFATVTVAVP